MSPAKPQSRKEEAQNGRAGKRQGEKLVDTLHSRYAVVSDWVQAKITRNNIIDLVLLRGFVARVKINFVFLTWINKDKFVKNILATEITGTQTKSFNLAMTYLCALCALCGKS